MQRHLVLIMIGKPFFDKLLGELEWACASIPEAAGLFK